MLGDLEKVLRKVDNFLSCSSFPGKSLREMPARFYLT